MVAKLQADPASKTLKSNHGYDMATYTITEAEVLKFEICWKGDQRREGITAIYDCQPTPLLLLGMCTGFFVEYLRHDSLGRTRCDLQWP